jgi:hypothetical protein
MKRVGLVAVFASVALLAIAGVGVSYSTYAKWPDSPVTFYVNPANADVSANAAANAVQYALNVWSTETGTTFRYQYGGTVNDTATKYDNRNVLMFRNASNGSAIGTTYSWWDSNKNLLDSDIIMWSSNFNFFTGIIGCGILPNAAYIEDIAAHELGHALGLNHSSNTAATMYPSYSYCSQALRSLASDDIAGAKALYPAGAPPSNTAPVVAITSPANGATFVQGSTISLAGTATDTQDGNISSRIQWTDNGVPVGSGNLLSSILSLVGIHTIRATVTDNAGAQASSQVSVTITLLGSGGGGSTVGTLTATKRYTSTGWERVTLRWTGLSGSTVDVYRNGSKVMNTANDDGVQTDNIGSKGPGTYVYRVCAANTQTCTPDATVVF